MEGNYGNSLSRIFSKNFVKVTVLLIKLLKSWFDEIFLVRENFSFFHSVTSCAATFSKSLWNQFWCVIWRNFLKAKLTGKIWNCKFEEEKFAFILFSILLYVSNNVFREIKFQSKRCKTLKLSNYGLISTSMFFGNGV